MSVRGPNDVTIDRTFDVCTHAVYKRLCPLDGEVSVRVPVLLPRDGSEVGVYEGEVVFDGVVSSGFSVEVAELGGAANCGPCGSVVSRGGVLISHCLR